MDSPFCRYGNWFNYHQIRLDLGYQGFDKDQDCPKLVYLKTILSWPVNRAIDWTRRLPNRIPSTVPCPYRGCKSH